MRSPGQGGSDIHVWRAGASLSAGQAGPDAQTAAARADLSPASWIAKPTAGPPGDLDRGQVGNDIHGRSAPVHFPPAIGPPKPSYPAPGVSSLGGDQTADDSHPTLVPAVLIANGHALDEIHGGLAIADNVNGDQHSSDTHTLAVADASEDGHVKVEAQVAHADPSEALLLILGDALDDLERQRIASENRLRSLRQVKGLEGSRAEAKLEALTAGLVDLEHTTTLELRRAMREHPLGPFVKRTTGLGEKQAARLLAVIGSPGDRPNVAKLWAYCGHGDPARSRPRKGERLAYNPLAKSRTYLAAAACLKAGVRKLPDCDDSEGYDIAHREATTAYGRVYLDGRAKYADAIHPEECPRCGPKGKPAPKGSPLSDAHKHARALRLVGKAILRDLWREVRATADPDPSRSTLAPTAEEAVT